MSDTPSPGAAAESARVPTVPQTPAARARKSAPTTPRAPAPAHATIPAAVVDGLVVVVLGACLFFRRLDSSAERIVAILVIAAVAGVHVVDLLRAQLRGGPPGGGTGTGLTLAVMSALASVGHHLAARMRVVAHAALFFVVLALGCASGPRTTDATVKTVLSVATLARDTACGPMLDGYLGRPQPVSLDAPAGTVVEVTQRIRDWLCGDTLAGLLDLARDLSADLTRARPSSAPPAPRASPTPAASPPPTAPPEASAPTSDTSDTSDTTGTVTP